MSSRWIELLATTNSGKVQFVCRYCGSVTPAPTKDCKEPPKLATGGSGKHPHAGKSCLEIEKEEAEKDTKASILWTTVARADALVFRVQTAVTNTGAGHIREDRLRLLDYLRYRFRDQLRGREGDLEELRKELSTR